jgi:outer membrane lipoprotein
VVKKKQGVRMKQTFLFLLLLFSLPSCTHVISPENREAADRNVSFGEILANPELYVGKTFILGGIIAETANTKDGAHVELAQTPVDSFGYIANPDASEGRLIVKTRSYLDPLIFRTGRSITFAGVLTGTDKKMLGEIDYSYPVFEAKEVYLWKEGAYYRYNYPWPAPYWYPGPYPYYWYDPYWYPWW